MADGGATSFALEPSGPFDLADQARRFGGWPPLEAEPDAMVMAFPIEGSEEAAAIVLRQDGGGVTGAVHGCPDSLAEVAWRQALAALSLDADGSGWPGVGGRDPVMGGLQEKYGHLRPSMFHSPYEAAAGFVIGHRISIKQARALRTRVAEEFGTRIDVGGESFAAFPTPGQLVAAGPLPSISALKVERLHAIAAAAQEGWLERGVLRDLPEDEAIERLLTLPGVGPFFARGILYRGAGLVDALTEDDLTRYAAAHAYGRGETVSVDELREIAEAWRPYRMWAVVLLHVWVRNEVGMPSRRR
ncbi:MAG: DNA-3-methyladenine glycosylase [Thermoleophilaceae bacterium]|nr:DNA-3-methyladenine glycosylase [Thermoleophilaceae bacterium]